MLRCHFLSVGEIDAQAFARDIAPVLVHIAPEHYLERFEEEVMRGVIPHSLPVVGKPARKLPGRARARGA